MNHVVSWIITIWLPVFMVWNVHHRVQAQNRIFDHYGPKDGLVTSQVLSIAKDTTGFLWLGTENGLARFDAHTFRYFRHDYKNIHTLSSNYVSDIQCDKHNRIWVSSGRNLDIFYPESGKVHRYEDKIFTSNSPKITHLYYDQKGDTLWVTTSKGLFYNAGKQISLKQKSFPGVEGVIHDMVKWDQFRYLMAGDKALFLYDSRKGKTTSYHHAYHTKGNDDGFISVFAENDSIVWAGSWIYGLLSVNVHTGQTRTFTFSDPMKSQNGVLDIQNVTSLKNELFLATTSGMYVFNIRNETFHSYTSENIFDTKAIAGAGFTLFEDNNVLWIGTYKGLHKYDHLKNFIQNIQLNISIASGNPQPQDLCFEKTRSGRDSIIWISFPYESIHRYDLTRQRITPMPAPLAGILENKKTGPYSMMIDKDEIIWISTERHPLLVFDLVQNIMIIPKFEKDWKGPVIQFFEEKDGQIWLATRESWFVVEKKNREVQIREKKDIKQMLQKDNPEIMAIPYIFTLDSKKNLWFLGLDKSKNFRVPMYYDMQKKKLHQFSAEIYPETRKLGWIDGLMVTSDDEVWISGFSGFGWIKKNVNGFTFSPYLSSSKINLDHTKFAGEDKQGNIIMSTDFGISYLNRQNNLLSAFSYYNSSVGNAIQPGIFSSRNGNKIYLGQKLSLDYFDPGKLQFPAPDALVLADISISRYIPEKNHQNGDVVRLKHDQNQIQLSVTNLFYTNAEFSRYYYRWSEKENWKENPDNHFHFSNLSHGTYFLQIKSSNAFGVWGEDIFSITFIISPPFYQAWWFYLIISMLGIGTVYLIFWYRDQQRRKMEKLRHHIARDLHDDLGSSLSYIRILSENEAGKTKDNLSFKNIAEKTAEIMNNMSEIIWSINPVYDSINNVVIRLQDFAIDTLEPLGIELKFDIDPLPEKYKLSPENRRQYYLVFKEAINNAAKYSKATKITLTIRHEKKSVSTILEDNGIGFDSLLIHKGNGLTNMKSRANILGGSLEIVTGDNGTTVRLDMKW